MTRQWGRGETKQCLDCPAHIQALGRKVRCPTCADIHFDKQRNIRRREKTAAKRAKKTDAE